MSFGRFVSMLEPLTFDMFLQIREEIPELVMNSDALTAAQILAQVVDFLQVVRCIITPSFGWSLQSALAIRWGDPIYVIHFLVNQLFKRWFWYTLMIVLVFVCEVSVARVVYLLAEQNIGKSPLKGVIDFFNRVVVNTILLSTIGWMLMPVECLYSYTEPVPFSDYVHTAGWGCTPFAIPDLMTVFVSFGLILPTAYFAYTSSLLSGSSNPFDENPSAQTGGCDLIFLITKILIIALPFVSKYITSVAAGALLALWSYYLMSKHISRLPFNRTVFNVVRGGGYTAIFFISGSGVGIGFLKMIMGLDVTASASQLFEWFLVGMIPVAVVLGACLVQRRRMRVLANANRVRQEYTKEIEIVTALSSSKATGESVKSFEEGEGTVALSASLPAKVKSKSPYERFYTSPPTGANSFSSGDEACVTFRTVFFMALEKDIPFLTFLLGKARAEYPSNVGLMLLEVLHLAFVIDEGVRALSICKSLKDSRILNFSQRYFIHIIEHRAGSQERGAGMGGGSTNAQSIAEFNEGLELVRKEHLQTIKYLRHFWSIPIKKSTDRGHVRKATIEQMWQHIQTIDRFRHRAKLDYTRLVSRYPSSITLLRQYAEFADVCLNDAIKADRLRKHASAIDEEEEVDDQNNSAFQDDLEGAATNSAATSDASEAGRLQGQKYIQHHRSAILGADINKLESAHRSVKQVLFIFIVCSIVTFCVTDLILFQNTAMRNLRLIDGSGLYAVHTIRACFYLRMQTVNSYAGNYSGVDVYRQRIRVAARELQAQHYENYMDIDDPSNAVSSFYLRTPMSHTDPVASKWKIKNDSFWYLGNDFFSRMDQASLTTADEFADSNFKIDIISPEKRNIPYIFENSFRYLLPYYSSVLSIYQEQVMTFGVFVTLVVTGACVINSIFMLILAYFVFTSLDGFITDLVHPSISSSLALHLPRNVSKKLHKYYQEEEINMLAQDDEDLQQRAIEKADVPVQGDEDRALEASNSQIDNDWFYSPNFTAFTEENVLQYIVEQDKIRMMSGRYGTCTEWDFILDGGKVKKGSQGGSGSDSGSMDNEDSGSPMMTRGTRSPLAGGGSPLSGVGSPMGGVKSPVGGRSPGGAQGLNSTIETAMESGSSPDSSPRKDFLHLRSPEMVPIASRKPLSPLEQAIPVIKGVNQPRPGTKSILRPKAAARQRPKSGRSVVWADSAGRSLLTSSHKILVENAKKLSIDPLSQASPPQSSEEDEAAFEIGRLLQREGSPPLNRNQNQQWQDGAFDAGRLMPRTGSPPLPDKMCLQSRTSSDDSDEVTQSVFETIIPRAAESSESSDGASRTESSSGSPIASMGGKWSKVLGRDSPLRSVNRSLNTEEQGSKFGHIDESAGDTGKEKKPQRDSLGPVGPGLRSPVYSPRASSGAMRSSDLQGSAHRGVDSDMDGTKTGGSIDDFWGTGGTGGMGWGELSVSASLNALPDLLPAEAKATPRKEVEPSEEEKELQEQVDDVLRSIKKTGGESPWNVGEAKQQKPGAQRSLDDPPPPSAVTADLVVSGFGPSEMLEQRGQVLELSRGPDVSKAGNGGQIGQPPLDRPMASVDVVPKRVASHEDSVEYSVESDHDHHLETAAGAAKRSAMEKKKEKEARNNAVTPMSENTQKEFATILHASKHFSYKRSIYVLMFIAMFGLCLSSILYPTRLAGSITNVAPLVRQSDRRHYLAKALTHLAHELAINDGFSRLRQDELASAMRWHIDQLVRCDNAIRMGGDLDLLQGADVTSLLHNSVMYDKGCPWRDDSSNCQISSRPSLGGQGLFLIIVEFLETCENVLSRYAPPDWVYTDSFMQPSPQSALYSYDSIQFNQTRYQLIQQDVDIAFLKDMFDGDLSQGLTMLQRIFLDLKEKILKTLHSDNRSFFALNMITSLLIFYIILFRTTVWHATDAMKRARKFVDLIPIHLLTKTEWPHIVGFFKWRNNEDMEYDDDGSLKDAAEAQEQPPDLEIQAPEAGQKAAADDHAADQTSGAPSNTVPD